MSGVAVFASSGSLLADRRYEYARAAAADAEHAAAIDLLQQALEHAPRWAPAWFALGEAHERLGAEAEAAQAFAEALACDPTDAQGAGLRQALLQGLAAPVMSAAYVRTLFDQYAGRFDAHLTGALGYRGPQLLTAALRDVCEARGPAFHFDTVLDLGCGTGLMGKALAPNVGAMHGVDLSPAMLAQAAKTGHYASLEACDMLAWLQARPAAGADLVIAADALVYCGDLAPLFAAAARALDLQHGGLFAFTAQRHDGAGFALGPDLRFAHAQAYLQDCARAAGLQVALLQAASTRRDAGCDVPGFVAVLTGADGARVNAPVDAPMHTV